MKVELYQRGKWHPHDLPDAVVLEGKQNYLLADGKLYNPAFWRHEGERRRGMFGDKPRVGDEVKLMAGPFTEDELEMADRMAASHGWKLRTVRGKLWLVA